ncbi:hypothetical protein, partial [Klebsiella pneumoniae]|uniref:hypothetical protein n=1 Tax=Klebsiella pneumoniae TaxID=573 RepID=UPI002270F413
DMDPFEAYLAWTLTLPGDVPRAAIDEAFAWVADECELDIGRSAPAAAFVPDPEAAGSEAVPGSPVASLATPLARRSSDTDNSIRV